MTERILHHFPLDPASRQVRLALGEKRLPFAEQTVRYWEQPDAFLDLNPSGVTPVMVEGDLVLCESRTILDHLEETVPEPPLLGRAPEERAEARRLVLWFDRKFDLEVAGFLLHEKMEKRLLSARDWLAGRRLSMADFAAAAYLSVIDYLGDVPWDGFPTVKTWYMKLKSRPAFRPLLADRWPGLVPAAHYDDLDF